MKLYTLTMHVPAGNDIEYKCANLKQALQLRKALEFFTEWPVWFSLTYNL